MLVEVKIPTFSESISEGTLQTWRKRPGEQVQRGEVLVELETDKVVLEISAPDSGVLTEIRANNGTIVTSDQIVATLDTEAQPSVQHAQPSAAPTTPAVTAPAAKPNLSPAVRKLVAENDLNPTAIPGSGKGGRITKADVLTHLNPATVAAAPVASPVGERSEKRVPMTRLRARIAERLKVAQNTAAVLTTFNEVNLKPVMDLRARYKDTFEKEHGVRLGFMSFFTKATIEALKKYPIVNASVDGGDIVYHGFFDIGVAVSSPRGLVVPIVRDADTLSFAQLEKQVTDLGIKARDGKLTIEDLSGGTFTISNGGVFGSLLSTPILNPPQSAILGMHKIQDRPIVEAGEIVARPMMFIALSYDHRIIDGHEAVLFLVKIKEALEDPARLLLQI